MGRLGNDWEPQGSQAMCVRHSMNRQKARKKRTLLLIRGHRNVLDRLLSCLSDQMDDIILRLRVLKGPEI